MKWHRYKFWQKKPVVRVDATPKEEFHFADHIYMRHTPGNQYRHSDDEVEGSANLEEFRQFATDPEGVEVAVYALVEVRTFMFPPTIIHTEVHRVIPESLPYPIPLPGGFRIGPVGF